MASANMSSNATYGIYNFENSTTTTDRAVGGLSTGNSSSKSINVYVDLHNTSTNLINDFTISYSVEKYRDGSNPAGFTVQLYYSADGVTWTSAGSNFTTLSPQDPTTIGYATTPGTTYTISAKNLPVSVAPNSHLYLAWNYSVTTGATTTNAPALGIDDVSITANNSSLITPPTLFSAGFASVDAPFNVTFSDNVTWRAAITSINVNGKTLTSGYTVSAGKITFTPSASNPATLLQMAGAKTIVVNATGYKGAAVNQTVNPGVPASLTVTTQPVGPTTSNGILTTAPVVNAIDKYGNTVNAGYTIVASVPPAQQPDWALSGTTSVNTDASGNATFNNLYAKNNTSGAYNATLLFTYGSATATSGSFVLPQPPAVNDNCSGAVTLTPSATPTLVSGSLISATPTPGNSFTIGPSKNDVWFKFTTPCTASYTINVRYAATTTINQDPDWEAFATGSCPLTGAGDPFALGKTKLGEVVKTKTSNLPGGTTYYLRVLDSGSVSIGNFQVEVVVNPPAQPSVITGGSITPCEGNTETYSVTPIAGLSYTWTLPGADWTGSSTLNNITAVAGSTAGDITVTPKNACGLSGTPRTLAVVPVTQPSNVSNVIVSPDNGSLTLSWDNPSDCFNEIMVVATDGSTVTLVPAGDGSLYIDTTEYASATKNNAQNMNPGEYCMYKGTGTAVVITGLLNSNLYKIRIFTRWGTLWSSGVQVPGTPIAVSTGAYRSVKSGMWTSNTTWSKYDGVNWVPTTSATDFPNYYGSDVTIQGNTIVQIDASPMAVNNLTVNANGQLWLNDPNTNKYVSVFGNLTCNGIIGNANPNIADNIGINVEGGSTVISGTGIFGCARIRKRFTASDPGGKNSTTLNINMNMNLFWNLTAMYNDAQQFGVNTTFNVIINNPYKVTLKNATGNVAIDGTTGSGIFPAGGKLTVNGTLNIPGILYLTTNNTSPEPKCELEIGTTGVVNTAVVNIPASGTSTHVLTIKNGGLLNVTDISGFAQYNATNNIINLNTGSTVQYSGVSGQQVLSGQTYANLTISGSGEKLISTQYSSLTVNGKLDIATGSFNLNNKTLFLNGTVGGTGTITGSALSNINIGPNATLTTAPLGVLRFTTGRDSLNTLTMDRMMKTDLYPNHKYWAAVLGSNLNVASLKLTQGILATDKYLLTLQNYTAGDYSTYNKASYVATTDTAATPFPLINTFDGTYGFRIKNVQANVNTYFPVGADFISPNRVLVNLGTAATRDLTVMLTKGDIIYTGSPRVNRVWYIKSSVNDSINASMRLYYTGYDLATYPYNTKQDELETGFAGTRVRLLEKAALNDHYFTNISNNGDEKFNGSPNTEVFAQYNKSVSSIYNGTKPGIYKFSVFSIVDGDQVVLPVTFTLLRAYQQGAAIHINWSVASETGIDHYEVERAGDGRLFGTVASQPARDGNSSNTYIATDMQPLTGANYYRIKAIGKDGQVMYSTIVSVTLGTDGMAGLLVYPNPVKNHLCHVQLTNLAAGTYHLGVYSMAGQLVASQQIQHAGGSSSQKLYLPAGTAAGVYVVKLAGQVLHMQTSVFVSGK